MVGSHRSEISNPNATYEFTGPQRRQVGVFPQALIADLVGIARATKGDMTPAETVCEIRRQLTGTCSCITSVKDEG